MPVSQALRLFSGGFERNDLLVTSGDDGLLSKVSAGALVPVRVA
jgi:hypothetical protein